MMNDFWTDGVWLKTIAYLNLTGKEALQYTVYLFSSSVFVFLGEKQVIYQHRKEAVSAFQGSNDVQVK